MPALIAPQRLIAFEGLNGTGKSALAAAVAGRLGVPLVRTPPREASGLRRRFDADPFSVPSQLFFLSWVAQVSADALAGRYDRVVVCDRYVGSTMSYLMGAQVTPVVNPGRLQVLTPSATVLVTAREDVRAARLLSRKELRAIDRATLAHGFRERVLEYLRSQENLLEIDTTALNIDTATTWLIQALAPHITELFRTDLPPSET